jgi:hypothetical protein
MGCPEMRILPRSKFALSCNEGLERVIDKRVRSIVSINDMQFGFMPGRGTTDVIFIVRQCQEGFFGKDKGWPLLTLKKRLTGY